ncbi:MAG: malate:quinone oxidoreductase, partial [Verrucomicrobiaceae bacterium]
MKRVETIAEPDVILIGGGIMSATLGVLLYQLDPTLKIQIVEALAEVAKESTNPWNNAGTGHAALCELNYTKENPDHSVDISKAVEINEAFEVSKQFWAYLVGKKILPEPGEFITKVPHMSFVRGKDDQAFLKRRHKTMAKHHFFSEMKYSEDSKTIGKWAELLLDGRHPAEPIAATRAEGGTDVNFGALTRSLVDFLASKENVRVATR